SLFYEFESCAITISSAGELCSNRSEKKILEPDALASNSPSETRLRATPAPPRGLAPDPHGWHAGLAPGTLPLSVFDSRTVRGSRRRHSRAQRTLARGQSVSGISAARASMPDAHSCFSS